MVSVVIRTFNRAELLRNAIESVFEQSYKNFELIIIDDYSVDKTSEVVSNYSNIDDRIVYVRHEKNSGPARSFNTANRIAKGKFVSYLDDDDIWKPDKLEAQIAVFDKGSHDLGLVTGGVQYWNSDRGIQLHSWLPKHKGLVYEEALEIAENIWATLSNYGS